jgi:hypothetical protein
MWESSNVGKKCRRGKYMTEEKNELLKKIAKLIEEYEDPTGHNCSNDVMVEISFEFGREKYIFNGESFVAIKGDK